MVQSCMLNRGALLYYTCRVQLTIYSIRYIFSSFLTETTRLYTTVVNEIIPMVQSCVLNRGALLITHVLVQFTDNIKINASVSRG